MNDKSIEILGNRLPTFTDNQKESLLKMCDIIYKENKEAAYLSVMLMDMAQTLDDIVDKDKDLGVSEIYRFAFDSMFNLQSNRLYRECNLDHHLLGVLLRWVDANTIEKGEDISLDDLHKCYMLRAGIYDIFAVIAYYLHGHEWSFEIGPTLRRWYGETFEEYAEEFKYARSYNGGASTRCRR